MPRLHFVKAARKDNPVAKKGEPYYWWQFAFGPKRYSKTQPSRSQLTQSDFLGQLYDIEDRIAALGGYECSSDLESDLEGIISDIRTLADEQDEKLQNMPESLQSSPSGEMLQERYDGMNSWADELESIDLEYDSEDESFEDWLTSKLEEIQSTSAGL